MYRNSSNALVKWANVILTKVDNGPSFKIGVNWPFYFESRNHFKIK